MFYSIKLDELEIFCRVLKEIQEEISLLKVDSGVSTDSETYINILNKYAMRYPDLYRFYGLVLQERFRVQEEKFNVFVNYELAKVIPNEKLKNELDSKTITIGKDLTTEQKHILQDSFPSGNFLLHTTNVASALSVIEIGSLMSSKKLSTKIGKSFDRGGAAGVSFNMNNVRVLTGDEKHFMGFLVAPEEILDDNTKLCIPIKAAEFEVSFLPLSYVSQFSSYVDEIEELPEIPTEKMYLFCSQRDADKMKYIISGRSMLKGVITYPSYELRVESWLEPIGDHIRAGELLNMMFNTVGLIPSINWGKDLFSKSPTIINNRVDSKDVHSSKLIIKSDGELEIL